MYLLAIEKEVLCYICGDLFGYDCPSFRDKIHLEPKEEKVPDVICGCDQEVS